MLLGHGAIGQLAVAEDLSGLVQNAGTVDVTLGQSASFSIGTETVTGTAVVSQSGSSLASTFSIGTETVAASAEVTSTTAGQIVSSVGEETPFGESFQNLVTLSTGSPNFFIWSEVDDSQTVTLTDVEPGSTD